ncbi:HK97 gp10 family phage protein [Thalassoglobus polymorphus]|uniref:Phage protein, HK97 gp10 family n=1 Tax=Thalassoglobus polymorphus TaxID=2527994 RepID=A0A517QPX7_9PLAN|nr:HK97 gp10 family phage protein [Thalassoglobus polymorphus]QDT33633.1 hypothetical protein Mal48_28870 [Thalassoglobus polymorphus]
MPMRIEISDTVSQKLRDLNESTILQARQEMVQQIATDVLANTAQRNPVETGRSRSGWATAAEQVSGRSTEVADSSGVGSSSGEGTATFTSDRTTSLVNATNNVPYITYLEYGTSRMAPFSMLRESLAGVLGRIGSMFRLSR